MGFPPAGAEVYYNEAGEPLGWDAPTTANDMYCDTCGFAHGGECPDEMDPNDYDEGDAVDDEGGMSEIRGEPDYLSVDLTHEEARGS
jgi:hypothetical protein